MSVRHVTTDHGAIRRWVEDQGGHPAVVTGVEGEEGILRLDLPGYSGQEFLQPVGWDEFFRRFDAQALAFEYEDEGRYFAFVDRAPRRV
jgi:hypothetical protein